MSYQIAGRAVKNEYLALGTIALTGALAALATGGEKKEAEPKKPATSSAEEEDFIKKFIAEAEKKEKKH